MKEIIGNVFDLAMELNVDSICITTNGIVGADGQAIMGAGTAGEAARRWPTVRANLGKALTKFSNLPFVIGFLDKDGNFQDPNVKRFLVRDFKCLIWSFPTKNDFRYKSDTDLIIRSATLLAKMTTTMNLNNIYLPRPGCSNGKLEWSEVKQLIEPLLDDRFTITSFEGE